LFGSSIEHAYDYGYAGVCGPRFSRVRVLRNPESERPYGRTYLLEVQTLGVSMMKRSRKKLRNSRRAKGSKWTNGGTASRDLQRGTLVPLHVLARMSDSEARAYVMRAQRSDQP
jgi:hypothetical protein